MGFFLFKMIIVFSWELTGDRICLQILQPQEVNTQNSIAIVGMLRSKHFPPSGYFNSGNWNNFEANLIFCKDNTNGQSWFCRAVLLFVLHIPKIENRVLLLSLGYYNLTYSLAKMLRLDILRDCSVGGESLDNPSCFLHVLLKGQNALVELSLACLAVVVCVALCIVL